MLGLVRLASSTDTIRLSLHVLAACVWIGGQIALGGLVPTVRGFGPDAVKKIAQVFARMAWPAFVVLVATGLWNVVALKNGSGNSTWQAVLGAKFAIVLVAALAVGLHTRAGTAKVRGLSAALGLVASLAAMVLGVLLAG